VRPKSIAAGSWNSCLRALHDFEVGVADRAKAAVNPWEDAATGSGMIFIGLACRYVITSFKLRIHFGKSASTASDFTRHRQVLALQTVFGAILDA
jgi:hypothetical protein